jgi:hypothetical protein
MAYLTAKMKDVEKIREGLYIKKSFDGYRVIHPIKREDGTINWFNLFTGGSYWNWVKLAIILIIIYFMTWSYLRDIRVCRELTETIREDPYAFCMNVTSQVLTSNWDVQIPNITIKEVENGET